MRRTIRLTGRKQLPVNCTDVAIREVGEARVLTLAITDPRAFHGLPKDAHVTLRLVENKQMELIDFGTVGEMRAAVDLVNRDFGDPSCQLRIASSRTDDHGLLLASTKPWRLSSDRPQELGGVKGILRFQPKNIAPRAWKLDIQENAHPVVEIDERIPDPRGWAKSNPVFIAAVLPSILERVFDDILEQTSPADIDWMNDWLKWADGLMPGYPAPVSGERSDKLAWIDRLVDSFCERHRLSDRIVDSMISVEAA